MTNTIQQNLWLITQQSRQDRSINIFKEGQKRKKRTKPNGANKKQVSR